MRGLYIRNVGTAALAGARFWPVGVVSGPVEQRSTQRKLQCAMLRRLADNFRILLPPLRAAAPTACTLPAPYQMERESEPGSQEPESTAGPTAHGATAPIPR